MLSGTVLGYAGNRVARYSARLHNRRLCLAGRDRATEADAGPGVPQRVGAATAREITDYGPAFGRSDTRDRTWLDDMPRTAGQVAGRATPEADVRHTDRHRRLLGDLLFRADYRVPSPGHRARLAGSRVTPVG